MSPRHDLTSPSSIELPRSGKGESRTLHGSYITPTSHDLSKSVFCACRELIEQFSDLRGRTVLPSQLPTQPGFPGLALSFMVVINTKQEINTELVVLITKEPFSTTFPYCPFTSPLFHNPIILSSTDPLVLPGKCQSCAAQRRCMCSDRQSREHSARVCRLRGTCPPHCPESAWLSPHLHREQREPAASGHKGPGYTGLPSTDQLASFWFSSLENKVLNLDCI